MKERRQNVLYGPGLKQTARRRQGQHFLSRYVTFQNAFYIPQPRSTYITHTFAPFMHQQMLNV